MIAGLVFDLDQTLFDRRRAFRTWLHRELRDAGESNGREQEILAIDADGYSDRSELLEHISLHCGWQEETQIDRRRRFRSGLLAELRPDQDLHALLAQLRTRYHLGLLSDGTANFQNAKIDQLRIRDFFDPVSITGTTGRPKPSPSAFELFAQVWQLPCEQICMIGDHAERDILGARDLGMQTIWISGGKRWQHASPPPTSCSCWRGLEALLV